MICVYAFAKAAPARPTSSNVAGAHDVIVSRPPPGRIDDRVTRHATRRFRRQARRCSLGG